MGNGREQIAPLLHPDCAHKRGGYIKIEIYTGDQYGRDKEIRRKKKKIFFAADCDKKRYNYTRTHIKLIY